MGWGCNGWGNARGGEMKEGGVTGGEGSTPCMHSKGNHSPGADNPVVVGGAAHLQARVVQAVAAPA